MNMKINFLAAMTLAIGLFSCSDEEGLGNTTPNEPGILGNAETYATIRIAMPGGNGMSRAFTKAPNAQPETGHGTEVGTNDENNFNDIALYFFDGHEKTSVCTGVLTMNSTNFTKSELIESQTVVYTTSEAIKVGIEGRNMKVYAVMNGMVNGANTGIKLESFLEKTAKTSEAFNSSYNRFLMTSRQPGNVTITSENNTAENAAILSVQVERTAAKITYRAEQTNPGQENQYQVTKEGEAEVAATVTLTDYKLVNLRNDAYFFRKVAGADGKWKDAIDFGNGEQTGSNYVIDPYFEIKTPDAAAEPNFFNTWFGINNAYAENSNQYTELPKSAEHSRLGYCMENTTTQEAQLNGYSTGIIFKAIYAPNQVYAWNEQSKKFEATNYTPGEDFYRYANALYKSKQEILDHYDGVNENPELIDTYIGDKNSGAACYYKYWFRHMDNDKPENMGLMEFAIVRNNVYKLSVKSVSDLGEPTDKIEPETPDETSKMYLKVNVSILPWVVRSNEGVEL